MSNYYIRITDEEPVDMEHGLMFRYNGTGSESEFTIVEESAYSTLVEQFEEFNQSTEAIINFNLDSLLRNRFIPKAESCKQILDDNDENPITYEDIATMLESYVTSSSLSSINSSISSHTSQINSLNSQVAQLNNNKASVTQLNSNISSINSNLSSNYYTKSSIDSMLNGKSSSSHKHSSWQYVDLEGGWTSDDCWLRVNPDIRLCIYHIHTAFDSATANKKYEWGSGTVGTVPSGYRPSRAVYGAIHVASGYSTGTMWVAATGKIGAVFNKGWKVGNAKTVYGDVVWSY